MMLSRMKQIVYNKILNSANEDENSCNSNDPKSSINKDIPLSTKMQSQSNSSFAIKKGVKGVKGNRISAFHSKEKPLQQIDFQNDFDFIRAMQILKKQKNNRSQKDIELLQYGIQKTQFYNSYQNTLQDKSKLALLCEKLQYTYYTPYEELMAVGDSPRKMILLFRGTVCLLVQQTVQDGQIKQQKNSFKEEAKESFVRSSFISNKSSKDKKQIEKENLLSMSPEECVMSKYKNFKIVKKIYSPDVIGDIELFHQLNRSSTIVTMSVVHAATLEIKEFNEIFMEFQQEKIKDMHPILQTISLLKNSFLFSQFDNAIIHYFIRYSNQLSLARGQCIYKQGESAKDVFIIEEGEVELKQKNNIISENAINSPQKLIQQIKEKEENELRCTSSRNKNTENIENYRYVAVLGKGEAFGEDFLQNTKRNHSAVCKSARLTLLKVNVELFLGFFSSQRDLSLEQLDLKSRWRSKLSETANKIEQKFGQAQSNLFELNEMQENANQFEIFNAFLPELNKNNTFNITSQITSRNQLPDKIKLKIKSKQMPSVKVEPFQTSRDSRLHLNSFTSNTEINPKRGNSHNEFYQLFQGKTSSSKDSLQKNSYQMEVNCDAQNLFPQHNAYFSGFRRHSSPMNLEDKGRGGKFERHSLNSPHLDNFPLNVLQKPKSNKYIKSSKLINSMSNIVNQKRLFSSQRRRGEQSIEREGQSNSFEKQLNNSNAKKREQIIVQDEYYQKKITKQMKDIEGARINIHKKQLHFNPFKMNLSSNREETKKNSRETSCSSTENSEINDYFLRAQMMKELKIDQKFPYSTLGIDTKLAMNEINFNLDKEHSYFLKKSNLERLRKKVPVLINVSASQQDILESCYFFKNKKSDEQSEVLKGYDGNIDQIIYLKQVQRKIEEQNNELYFNSNYNFIGNMENSQNKNIS